MVLSVGHEQIDPHLKRWMLFVDGENLTIRGQHAAMRLGLNYAEGPLFKRDVFLWLPPERHATRSLTWYLQFIGVRRAAERAFYYTSEYGDTDAVNQTRMALWELGFTPEVFKKRSKNAKAKGVDIALTKDLLSNAYLGNYEVAVIITGDADFQPVIAELKRMGKTVCVMAFTDGGANVSMELKLGSDYFIPLDFIFEQRWNPKRISASDEAGEAKSFRQ